MSINSSLFGGHPGSNKLLMTRTICDENGIRRAYSANAEPGFFFGTDANTTFLVRRNFREIFWPMTQIDFICSYVIATCDISDF